MTEEESNKNAKRAVGSCQENDMKWIISVGHVILKVWKAFIIKITVLRMHFTTPNTLTKKIKKYLIKKN